MSIVVRPHKRHGQVYAVRLRDPGGRTFNKTFRTKTEARRYENDQLAQLARGSWTDPRASKAKFRDVATEWLESNPAKRESALARDEIVVRCHLLPALGDRTIGSVRPADVQQLIRQWIEADHQPRTVRRQFGVLRAIFNFAVADDLLAKSPCRNTKLPAVEVQMRKLPQPDELELLASELGTQATFMWIGAVLGLRWGEVAGLRVGRVDVLRGQVTVAEQQTRDRSGASVSGPPKSVAGRRTLAIPGVLAEMLSAHMAERGLTAADSEALLFTGQNETPLHYNNWRRRIWNPACERAGLAGLGFHDLRRLNATTLVASGVDVKTAQSRLGHSDPRLTLAIYAQATTQADREAADAVGNVLMREAGSNA